MHGVGRVKKKEVQETDFAKKNVMSDFMMTVWPPDIYKTCAKLIGKKKQRLKKKTILV